MIKPDQVEISTYFEKRDLWIGIHWNYLQVIYTLETNDKGFREEKYRELSIYICIIPCFPIRLVFRWKRS